VDQQSKAWRVAERIADDSAIDWSTAATEAANPSDRALVEQLRSIAEIATLHRSPEQPSADGSDPESERWGALTLISRIGTGRFGEVYMAWDARLQRRVALKLLHVSSASLASPTRAIDEARLLARVRHPNVLTVYGAEFFAGRAGIWTEFIEGRNLSAIVAEHGPLEADEVVPIGLDLCRALAAVHDAGLLHRDIKAQNVMRETGGRTVLMDFGTGHDLALAPAQPGDWSGTPLYLAPEVLNGAPASQASDIYALGVLLFHLLTGTFPVVGKTLDEVRKGHQVRLAARLRGARRVPDALRAALEAALAPDPSRRFERANQFADALSRGGGSRRVLSGALGATALLLTIVTAASALLPAEFNPPVDPIEFARLPGAVAQSGSAALIPMGPEIAFVGPPSGDGRLLPIVDANSRVQSWKIGSGERHELAGPLSQGESLEFPLLSSDGSRVVVTASSAGGSELRLVDTSDGSQRTLIPKESAVYPQALEWSRDGADILCFADMPDSTTALLLVHAAGGSSRLMTWNQGRPKHASLSADGRFVVFDLPDENRFGKRDILILDVIQRTSPRILVGGSANNVAPVWTSRGDAVFFISDRSGTMDGWVVPVSGGNLAGEPLKVALHLNRVAPLGFTDDGRFYFMRQVNAHDVYTVSVDDQVAHAETRAPISTSPGRGHIAPAWSPDGRFISYITTSGTTAWDRDSDTLTIQELATGRTRDLHLALSRLGFAAPRWAPDSRRLLIRGGGLDGRPGYFVADVVTNHVTPVLHFEANHDDEYGAFGWAPDGRSIFFLRRRHGLIAHALDTSKADVIVPKGERDVASSLVMSPDGSQIAFTSAGPGGRSFIEIVTLRDKQRRDVFVASLPNLAVVQAWTPDGRDLLFTTQALGSDLPARLWRISVSGGEPRDMELTVDGNTRANKMALSPDGRRLAFTEGVAQWETWMLSDFLSGSRR
jgi:serine/threonine protein kinase